MYSVTSSGSGANGTNFYDYSNLLATGTAGSPNTPGVIQLNGWSNGLNEMSSGEIAEVIYYDRVLTNAERLIIEGYLAYKYNMQVPLATMQAFQTYAAGVSTRTFQAADAAGNLATTTATATATLAYPGPVVTNPVAPACNTMTFTTSDMAPAGKRLTVNSADWLCVGGTGSCSAAGPWTSNLAVGSNWTIEAWVNLSTIPSNTGGWNTLIRGTGSHHIIIDRGGNGGSTTGQIGVFNGGFFGSGYNIIGSGLTGWHHITAVGSGGRTQFFVDGVRVGIANSQPTDNVVAIGNFQGGGQHSGQIDEVRIWNVALPHSTLGSFQTRNITNTHPNWNNLVGYYKMDGTFPVPNSASGTNACVSCTGVQVGGATVSADVNYYTYTWTASSGTVAPALVTTNESIVVTGAAQGAFSYTVRAAANGCNSATTSGSVVVPIIGVPSVNGSTTTTTASICGTGTITAVAGTNANTTRFYNGIPPSAGGTGSLLNPPGGTSYTVTTSQTLYVTSYNSTTGCESSTYVTVVVTQTPTFSISQSNTNVSCFNGANGSATVSVVSGGTQPFTFTWSNGTVNTVNNPAPVSNTITGLAAGTYTVNVKDNGSCNNSTSFTVTQPTQVVITGTTLSTYAGGFNISCNGGNNGSVTVNSVTGGTGAYSYTWSNLATSSSISSLVAGNYSVTVRDVNLCSATQSFTLSEPATLSTFITASYICSSGGIYVAAELTANPSGGAGPYTYVWSNGGATTQTIGSLANGVSRTVTVTDANGCQAVASFTTAFPPNGSSVNCNFVYVAANGDGSAGALASKDCPATFERGLLIFAANPARNVMLMQAGDYGVYNATITIPSNLTIDGDYEVVGGDWRKNSALATNIHINPSLTTATVSSVTVGNYIGLNASSASGFTLKDVNVYVKAGNNGSGNLFNSGTATGVTSSRGNSVYGFYADNATAYSLTRCLFITGAAPKGANGSTPSAGGGGGGGAGGGGGGTGYDCNNGSGGGGGQPGSAGASGGFGGGQGNNNGCNTVGCDANGGNGNNAGSGAAGAAGSGYGPGSLGAPAPSGAFYLPGGQSLSGNNGAGGGGGGGGGGAAVGSCCTCGCGSGNANGGNGGNGGAGGQGGTGGFGGGGSFPVYLVGGTGTITDVQTNAGAGGAGGDGASGSPGLSGNGGAGGNAMSRCSVTYFGGSGGSGGNGGAGGRGQDGTAGASQGFVSLSGGPTQNGTTIPAPTTITALQNQGCANSVITITKNTGTWTLPTGAQFVNDVSTSVASSGTSSNTASIYFTSPATTGLKDLAVGAGAANTFKGFINIRTSTRTLPSINAITTPICPNTSISIGTGATADAYAWSVQLISSPNSASSPGANLLSNTTAQNPGLLTLTTPGTYQVKLQAFDFCCGWTIPVYATVVVSSAPSVPGAISGDQTVCAGATKTYSISPVGGAASYVWTIPSGASIQGANNGTSISVLYPVSAGSGNITVLAQNGCVPPQQSTTSSIPITISGLPSVSISPQATALCSGTAIQMTGGASGGSGTYTNYTWTPAGSINGSNTTQVVNTTALTTTVTYTLQVTDNLGCIGSTNQIINVNPQPVAASVTPTPAAGTICEGTSVSATIGTGSGGIGTITNVVEFTTNTGGAWSAYASNNSIASNGLSGANVIQIRSIRSATGLGCNSSTINASWTVNPAATVNAGSPATICSGSTHTLTSSSVGGGATTGAWSIVSTTGSLTTNVAQLSSAAQTNNPSVVTYTPVLGTSGTATLRLTTNDPDGAGPCAAANSQIVITVNPNATVNAGSPATICSGSTHTLTGSSVGGGATTGAWSIVSTTGSLTTNVAQLSSAAQTNNPSVVTYTPILGTSGTATLQLTTNDPDGAGPCAAVTSQVVITVNLNATVSTPANQTVCSSGTPLSGTTIGGATSVTWTAASGTFSNANALNPTYDPSIMTGSITLTVTTNDPDGVGPCAAASATKNVTVNTEATANAGPDLATCVNTAITIPNGNASVSIPVFEWTKMTGGGSLSGEATLTPTYNPVAGDAGNSITLRLDTDDPDGGGPCPAVFDEMNIQVDALPSTANAGSDIFDCSEDLVVTLAASTPSIGLGAWSGSATFAPGNTPNSTATVASTNTYTFTWTVTNGTCAPSADQVEVRYNNPLPITNVSGASGSCVVNDNAWHHIFDANGNVILSVNSNGENLGNVTVSVNIGSPSQIANNVQPGNCFNSFTAYMGRNFRIVPTNQPTTSSVDVRFYFTPAELAALQAAALGNNDGDICDDDDDVTTIANVGVTKYNTGFGPGGAGIYIAQSSSNGTGNTFNANYIQISTPSFSDFYLHGSGNNAPLPVELISFTATPINNQYIRLDWATALEINNDGFELQRSTDAQSWTNITWIDGNDNSTITQFYNHNDMQVAQNITYYYRLKQIDNDGQFEYSSIVNATLTGSSSSFNVLEFVPNPTVDQTTLLISSGVAQTIAVSFYNAIGQVVQTNTHELSEGMNQITFDVNLLAAGTYMATVTSGNEVRTKRLVITR
jgi:hypothetical protein